MHARTHPHAHREDDSSDCAPTQTISVPLKDHGAGLQEVAKLVFPGV